MKSNAPLGEKPATQWTPGQALAANLGPCDRAPETAGPGLPGYVGIGRAI